MKIKKRSDGRFAVTKVYNGKRKYFYGRSPKEATAKLEAYEKTLLHNFNATDITYKEYTDEWLADIRSRVSLNTYASYQRILKNRILPELGSYKISEITSQMLKSFLLKQAGTNVSANYMAFITVMLHMTFKQAVIDELLTSSPAEYLQHLKANGKKHEAVALTKDELHALLKVIPPGPMHRIFELDVLTGLRRGEILGLRWQDINIDNATLSVNQTILYVNRQIIISPTTKTKSSRRTISLSNRALEILREQQKFIAGLKLLTTHWQEHDLVFTKENGEPIGVSYLSNRASAFRKRANLPKGFTFHSLRHTHATLLLQAGVNFKAIQYRLGHSTATETMNIYSHYTPLMEIETTTKIDDIFK